ncbi:MAG: SIR2 family protein [Chthoniobacteraceae bacterium]
MAMEDLREIANEKLRQNSPYRKELLSLISSGEAIAFIGAGLSSSLGYPSWPDLIATLHTQVNKISAFESSDQISQDILVYAQLIKEYFGTSVGGIDQYESIIGREFAPKTGKNCTSTHQNLVKLPFRAFVTTNYDVCIEQALQEYAVQEQGKARPDPGVVIKASKADRHLVSRFLRSISEKNENHECYVAHLHGCWNDTQNIILTSTDYAEAYDGISTNENKQTSITLHRQLAWSLFATRRMVFIGCSMDDPYIKRLLDTVARELWEFNQPIHFAILPLDKKRLESSENEEAAFLRYGLQVVYFDNLIGNFTGLDQLLQEALEKTPASIKKLRPTQPPPDVQSPGSVISNPIEPQMHLRKDSPNAQVNLEWLDEVNKTTIGSIIKNED